MLSKTLFFMVLFVVLNISVLADEAVLPISYQVVTAKIGKIKHIKDLSRESTPNNVMIGHVHEVSLKLEKLHREKIGKRVVSVDLVATRPDILNKGTRVFVVLANDERKGGFYAVGWGFPKSVGCVPWNLIQSEGAAHLERQFFYLDRGKSEGCAVLE